ncbi:MAG: hypothetical protein CM1200mP22_22550 [Dehalococcoidia bacterium]|nr:MAG: hypothetical protein CM1200mP22_22550 [Dehalococcoidia bacterium]
MEYEHVSVENEAGVAIIRLNRPEVLNAMNHVLNVNLHDAMVAANDDDDIGCIVITGTGEKAFSAGGDIHEQREDAGIVPKRNEMRVKRSTHDGSTNFRPPRNRLSE